LAIAADKFKSVKALHILKQTP